MPLLSGEAAFFIAYMSDRMFLLHDVCLYDDFIFRYYKR